MPKVFYLSTINNWPTYCTTGSKPVEVVGVSIRGE